LAIDDKVAFYLRHRTVIEEWAALRQQAAVALEECLFRAVGIIRQRPSMPRIVENDSSQYPTISISLEVPSTEPDAVCVALGWSRSELLKPAGYSWPYMGIKTPGVGRGEAVYEMVKDLLRDSARDRHWPESEFGWAWWGFIPLGLGETDLDGYALRHVEGLVAAWKALQSGVAE
jgi:hypothetical protein